MSVKHALLALLYQREMHGYELGKQLPLVLNQDWDVKPGQIAGTLTRLERDGLVAYRVEPVADAPDRKVYALTDFGMQELVDWYLTPEIREYRMGDEFYIKLVFSLIHAPVSPEDVLMQQRRRLFQELHDVTNLRETLNTQTELPYVLLLETAIIHLDADIRWLEMCEARLPELKKYRPPHRNTPPAK